MPITSSWIVVLIFIAGAAAANAEPTRHDECTVPFEMPRSLSQVHKELELSRTRVQRARTYQEDFQGQMSAKALAWSVRHAEWLLTYYETLDLVFKSGDARSIEKNLNVLESTLDPSSDAEGYSLLDLYAYLGELSDLAVTLNPATFDAIMANLQAQITEDREDPTTNPMVWQRKLIRYHLYKLHFANVLYRPDDIPTAHRAIVELVDGGLRLPEAYLAYLDGYASMTSGLNSGDKFKLVQASESYVKALEAYGVDCAPRMATRSAYHLAHVYKEIATHHSNEPENQKYVRNALNASAHARAYASLLEAPDEWRAVHRLSGEVYELASRLLLVSEGERKTFDFLGRRSFELSTSF